MLVLPETLLVSNKSSANQNPNCFKYLFTPSPPSINGILYDINGFHDFSLKCISAVEFQECNSHNYSYNMELVEFVDSHSLFHFLQSKYLI